MTSTQKWQRLGEGRGEVQKLKALYGNPTDRARRLPADWRGRLPVPADYYGAHVAKLGKRNGSGWAQGWCPFHDDHDASLSVNLHNPRGGWRCFAGCGGGDLVGFHMRMTGKPFKEAVADLIGQAVCL